MYTQAKMERSEVEIPRTVLSEWQERECAKQELSGHGVDQECLSTRRLASILNKGLVTIDYNEVIYFHNHQVECPSPSTRSNTTITIHCDIAVNNQMPLWVRNTTSQMTNAFRYWMGAYMSDNQYQVRNTDNHIRIETVYYPIIGSVDVHVHKPSSNTFYHGIEIHPTVETLLPFNPRLSAFRSVFGGPGIVVMFSHSNFLIIVKLFIEIFVKWF